MKLDDVITMKKNMNIIIDSKDFPEIIKELKHLIQEFEKCPKVLAGVVVIALTGIILKIYLENGVCQGIEFAQA